MCLRACAVLWEMALNSNAFSLPTTRSLQLKSAKRAASPTCTVTKVPAIGNGVHTQRLHCLRGPQAHYNVFVEDI